MVPIGSFFFLSNHGIFKVKLEVIRKSVLGLAGMGNEKAIPSPKGRTRWRVGRISGLAETLFLDPI